jgi:uncharacterized RDD family membrane protein YckC
MSRSENDTVRLASAAERAANSPPLRAPRPLPPPFVGFWNRTAAALIDSALLVVVTLPLQQGLAAVVVIVRLAMAPGSASLVGGVS